MCVCMCMACMRACKHAYHVFLFKACSMGKPQRGLFFNWNVLNQVLTLYVHLSVYGIFSKKGQVHIAHTSLHG